MKRVSRFMVGISLLITGLAVVPLASASAMNSSSGSNACENSGFPAPYTGGANIAKFFHLTDGSTVTITQTGAVIKQSPCHTAYREGWINVSDICDINSAQDLSGRLAAGSSNPFGHTSFTNCSTSSQTANTAQRPTEPASQSQSQSQSITVNVPQVQAAVTAKPAVQTTQSTAAVRTLPNTGPGNILMLSGATTAVGTLGHLIYSRRKRFDK